MIETLIFLLIALVVLGLILYVVNALLPVDQRIKIIIQVVVVLIFLVWLLKYMGMMGLD